MLSSNLNLAVIICTVGRPENALEVAKLLAKQSAPADQVFFVVPSMDDVGGEENRAPLEATGVRVILSPKGLTTQRNAGLNALSTDCDIVCFFDDDFVPSRYALERTRIAFERWPEVSGMTGHLIADGIRGPGISQNDGKTLVDQWDAEQSKDADFSITRRGLEGLYGCNMAVRHAHIGKQRFDERLPLYGWQEDIDFAARLPGERIKTDAMAGVHLGVKSGRETSGRRLGYSQLANTWYLWRKGTISFNFASNLAIRNFVVNHLRTFNAEPWIDRKGRAVGNWMAIWDILCGRARPEKILEM